MISPTTSEPSGSPSPGLAVSASPSARDLRSSNSDLRDGDAVAESRRSLGEGGLRLAHWHTHEPPRSRRTEEAPDRICVPTSPDSLGYRLVCAEPDGPALWCAWTLLVGIAGRHARALRGFLVHPCGRPCTAADLGLMTGFPAALFERALAFFSAPGLGWLVPAGPDAVPTALREIAEARSAREALEKERFALSQHHREVRRRHRAHVRLAEKLVADPADRPAFIARLIAEEQNALTNSTDQRDSLAALTAPAPALPSAAPSASKPAAMPPSASTALPAALPRSTSSESSAPPAEPPPRDIGTKPTDSSALGSTTADIKIPGVPRNWRALLIDLIKPATPESRAQLETARWADLRRDLKHKIFDHPRASYS